MRAFIMTFGVVVAACSGDGSPGTTGDVSPDAARAERDNPAACPAVDVFLAPSFPVRCVEAGEGIECRYTAIACDPGEKPDNVCHCVRGELTCEGHLRSCLPLSAGAFGLTAAGRPLAKHRPTAVQCVSPAAVARDATCAPEQPSPGAPPPACVASGDCGNDEACLQRHLFGGSSVCACIAAECLGDADCGTDELCGCGANDPATHCDGPYYRTTCSNRCVTALCKTDADCPGGTCSPSPDPCNSSYDRWACHDETQDECMSDAECAWSADGNVCRHTNEGWRCTSGPICD